MELERVGKLKTSCDEEFFRLTRRKREGVVRYVERAATMSGGKITVTVRLYQPPLMDFVTFIGMIAADVISRFVYDWLKQFFKDDD